MDIILKHTMKTSYWEKRAIMLLLCNLHTLTRYKVARTIEDLFYSPNGFCFHTVVVIACLATLLWSMYDDAKMFAEMTDDFIEVVKEAFKQEQ